MRSVSDRRVFQKVMNLSSLTALAVIAGTGAFAGAPVLAQAPVAASEVRALNLARNTAVTENGGLSVYRPQQCMFQTSTGGGECLVDESPNGYTFRFLGGSPGWPSDGSDATTETEIQISPDGRSVIGIIYNGAPR
jgi:hypothetical protein